MGFLEVTNIWQKSREFWFANLLTSFPSIFPAPPPPHDTTVSPSLPLCLSSVPLSIYFLSLLSASLPTVLTQFFFWAWSFFLLLKCLCVAHPLGTWTQDQLSSSSVFGYVHLGTVRGRYLSTLLVSRGTVPVIQVLYPNYRYPVCSV